MTTPDWNKIANTPDAAVRMEESMPSAAERLLFRRMIQDFESLTRPGKFTLAVYISIRLRELAP